MDETLAERVRALIENFDHETERAAEWARTATDSFREAMSRKWAWAEASKRLRALLDTPALAPVGDVEGRKNDPHWRPVLGFRHLDGTVQPCTPEEASDWLAAFAAAQRAEALREAATDPALRLSGHSGISITRLLDRADAEARP